MCLRFGEIFIVVKLKIKFLILLLETHLSPSYPFFVCLNFLCQISWYFKTVFLIYASRIEESAPDPIRRIIDKENDSPVPKYKRDLVQKLKILKLELQNLQPQGGHCRMEVSREEIFEVRYCKHPIQDCCKFL